MALFPVYIPFGFHVLFNVLVVLITSTTSQNNIQFRTFYYSQPIDHYGYGNMSKTMFNQRFIIDYTYVPTHMTHPPPIFAYLGGESQITRSLELGENGITSLAARHFQGVVVYIEHRFYGESVPFGSVDIALSDPEVRGCLNSEQALADYAEIILYIKRNSSFASSQVFAIGGSYAGMLSAWFRLKYPHIVTGALSSSAPVISPSDIPPKDRYCAIVTKDFTDISEPCANNIRRSWRIIDDIASTGRGLDDLSRLFQSCSPLLIAGELKVFLAATYYLAAQYDGRFQTRTSELCKEIGFATSEDEILPRIAGAISTVRHKGDICMNLTMIGPSATATMFGILDADSQKAWDWQLCSELLPPGGCDNSSMFEPSAFNITEHMEYCRDKYGVYPHPNWMTTYYGGQDMKHALKRFGSNIIFSNGLRDPLSGAGILHDLSGTITAITTKHGSHCLDLNPIQEDDPEWLKQQRKKELKKISEWIEKSSSDVRMTWSASTLVVVALIIIVMF